MKKILSTLFISTLLLSGATQAVNAEQVDTKTSEASISFTKGDLLLESVNQLNFNNHQIGSSNDNTYSSEGQNVTVKDFRGLAEGEWNLNASITRFKDKNENETLPGFKLTYSQSGINNDNNTNTLDGPSTSSEDKISLQYTDTPEDGIENFLSATNGEGRGSWTAAWENVSLFIPEGAETVGEHTATITWELLNAPQ